MSTPQKWKPIETVVSPEDLALFVTWQDGHTGFYPFDFLRGACPCVACKRHHRPIDIVLIVLVEGVALLDVATVGNYALRFLWSDAHNTGIYDYEYLRSLCRCKDCTG